MRAAVQSRRDPGIAGYGFLPNRNEIYHGAEQDRSPHVTWCAWYLSLRLAPDGQVSRELGTAG